MPIKIIFMGSSDFSAVILRALASQYSIVTVITQPDKPAGRGKQLTAPPVKILAEELGLTCIQPPRLRVPEVFEQLQQVAPDLIVVAAYGQILRQNILDLPRYGCINVHASYLPRWRGAAPIQAAILHGDDFTGVTIMKMDAGIDTGPELAKTKVAISLDDTSPSLSNKLAQVGAGLLLETLSGYLSGVTVPVPQVEDGATYASMIKKEEGQLDFSAPVMAIERKIRAFYDWPGTWMEWEGQILKIRKAVTQYNKDSVPGQHGVSNGFPTIGALDGDLVLLEVQPSGKRWMNGADFLRGTRNWI